MVVNYATKLAFLSLSLASSVFPPTEHDRPLPEDDLGDKEQRLALYVIKEKCNFVPEHIEERTLYNPIIPHISMVNHATTHYCR